MSNFAEAERFNGAGYALVLVDARGSGASFGMRRFELAEDEVRDYGEVVDWIIEQPWSNGRVGAYGVSYAGNTAEMLAVNMHPAVKAVARLGFSVGLSLLVGEVAAIGFGGSSVAFAAAGATSVLVLWWVSGRLF